MTPQGPFSSPGHGNKRLGGTLQWQGGTGGTSSPGRSAQLGGFQDLKSEQCTDRAWAGEEPKMGGGWVDLRWMQKANVGGWRIFQNTWRMAVFTAIGCVGRRVIRIVHDWMGTLI